MITVNLKETITPEEARLGKRNKIDAVKSKPRLANYR
jgi:hypothetical protein